MSPPGFVRQTPPEYRKRESPPRTRRIKRKKQNASSINSIVVGRGEKGLLCDPGSELPLLIGGGEKRRGEGNKWDGKKDTKATARCRSSITTGTPETRAVAEDTRNKMKKKCRNKNKYLFVVVAVVVLQYLW